ncbi:related to beta-galactosidase precursor [Melanopsichium pennsylvanicum]|uniref:beta-galactosidase n=2 Tax=Melanopsichium pennsylvanicum TaxID=63383 RepID=A0AAJ5C4H1_9BASI|nr:related to beta-galactosidase precursor [Melanopsichium pennsylvanicum 4]SNX83489.1 related to beta-galactosidase precursor [Melanopsichium pennsylvanicum]
MRRTIAALTSCLLAFLAICSHLAIATQAPFSIESLSQQERPSYSTKTFPPQTIKWTLPKASNNSAVVYDKYSLALANGQQRLFVFAAEFHPWRLPVPSLWRDVLQKIRAAGFNTVSIYTHWALIQPNPDPNSIDLSGLNDLDHFLTVAKQTGLFVIVRPGPYINAETTVGGMAPWTINLDAVLRTNDTAWYHAWVPYIDAVSKVVVKHQLLYNSIGRLTGGSVILVQADNEYKTGVTERAYMEQLVSRLKSNGISLPITYNDPGRDNNFVDLVDLYGLDSYPQRFDCSHPSDWVPFRDDYLEYHLETNPDQPFYIPEFQGGSYDPYGGPGYEACASMTNSSFTRVANQALIAQRVTLLSLYMVYGGTNWGGLAEPDVYTSYDYGAALTEHRQTTEKYLELKRQGNLLAAFPDLAMTEQIFDKPGFNISQAYDLNAKAQVDPNIFRTTVLENPETKSKFYVVRYDNTTESRRVQFALDIETLGEKVTLGERRSGDDEVGVYNYLDGRDSRIIAVDQQLPAGLFLRFSTSNVYRISTIANLVVVTLDYGPQQMLEWSLSLQHPKDGKFVSADLLTACQDGVMKVHKDKQILGWEHSDIKTNPQEVRGSFRATPEGAKMVYKTSSDTYVVLHFSPTSFTRRDFAVPVHYSPSALIRSKYKSSNLINQFFGLSEESIIMIKVDLLRNATYASTQRPLDTLYMYGSMSQDRNVTMFAMPNLKYVFWNGQRVPAETQQDLEWFYVVPLPGPSEAVMAWKPPKLSEVEWKVKDSIPEASASFDDSEWINANKTESFNPYTNDPGLDTQGIILFASEYGFHANNIVWRGHFALDPSQPFPSDVFVEVEGGRSSAFSVWLNGVYLGSAEADRETSAVDRKFTVPRDVFEQQEGGRKENVVTILQDHMGIEMEAGELPIGLQSAQKPKRALEAVKLPRGIIGFNFPSLRVDKIEEPKVIWKVQGNYKGEQAPDKVRRGLNEGGLEAEVMGWHLPGFDASRWSSSLSADNIGKSGKSRVMFYRTTFNLDIPYLDEIDVGLNLRFIQHRKRKGEEEKEVTRRTMFRAQLYVNGWQMGKYINNLGPQQVFPVHDGVFNMKGNNVIGVSVWNLNDETYGGDEEEWEWDPRTGLVLEVNHILTGHSKDGYVLDAPTWQQLRN